MKKFEVTKGNPKRLSLPDKTMTNDFDFESLTRATELCNLAFKKFGIIVASAANLIYKQIKPLALLYLEKKRGPSIGRKRRRRRTRGKSREIKNA